jgi:hypothetical protein
MAPNDFFNGLLKAVEKVLRMSGRPRVPEIMAGLLMWA